MKYTYLLALLTFAYVQSYTQSWKQLNDIGSSHKGTILPDIPGDAAQFSLAGNVYVVCGSFSWGNTSSCYMFDPVKKEWTAKNNFPDSLAAPVAFIINNIAYVGSGYSAALKKASARFWKYNETNDTWTAIASMPVARTNAEAFSLGDTGYVGLGTDISNLHRLDDFYKYDPITNKWDSIQRFAGAARCNAVSFTMHNKGYIGTGIDGSVLYKDFWCYSPLNGWTAVADLPRPPRYRAVAFELNGIPYTGVGAGLNFLYANNDFYRYNDSLNHWDSVKPFPVVLDFGVALCNGQQAFVGKGVSGQSPLVKMYQYHPDSNTWNMIQEYNGVFGAASFSANGKLYVVSGENYLLQPNRQTWEYDPVTGTWTLKAPFPGTARVYGQCSFAIANEGYIVGGSSNGANTVADCWKYNPQTDAWSAIAPMPEPRKFAACFVINNKAYITGGESGTSVLLTDCWEYNPLTDTWLKKPDMPGAARYEHCGFSIGNKGYIVGGTQHIIAALKDIWMFDPLNGWTQKNDFYEDGIFYGMATASATNAYVVMGRTERGSYSNVWQYTPHDDTWKLLTWYPASPVILGVTENMNNKLYIGLGANNQQNHSAGFFELDPEGPAGIAQAASADKAFRSESPFEGSLNMFYNGIQAGIYEVSVSDLSGRLVYEGRHDIENSNGMFTLPPTIGTGTGVYIIRIDGAACRQTLKAIKLR